jgi:DNA helicase HerA-like ATPase
MEATMIQSNVNPTQGVQAPVAACFGRRGTGKTTLARKIAQHQARVLVWDYMGEYGPLAFRSEGNLDALDTYLKEMGKQSFWAARFIPRTGDVEEFERFCVRAWKYRNYVLVIEEAAAVTQASFLPPNFGRLVRQGRHRGIGLLWCTQRLNEVSRTLTALTDYWCGFNIAEPADKLALVQRCGQDYSEEVSRLPRFEWRGFEVDTRETFTDEARLLALWGAPRVWKLPGAPANVAKATG